jgi:hypothetical protein
MRRLFVHQALTSARRIMARSARRSQAAALRAAGPAAAGAAEQDLLVDRAQAVQSAERAPGSPPRTRWLPSEQGARCRRHRRPAALLHGRDRQQQQATVRARIPRLDDEPIGRPERSRAAVVGDPGLSGETLGPLVKSPPPG